MPYLLHKPDDYQKVTLPGLRPWLQALRSGEYPQGEGRLCNGALYCCLGVLSQVQGRLHEHRAPGSESWGEGVLAEDNPLFAILNYEGLLPEGVHVTAHGLTRVNLVSLNDDLHLTFHEIADILEALYEDSPPPTSLTKKIFSILS
jgi:hypothetical protein